MPALPSPGQVIRCTLVFTIGGDTDVITRFFMSYAGSVPSGAELNTMAEAASVNWAAGSKSAFNADVVLTNCICEDLSSATGATGEYPTSLAGDRAGDLLTADQAFVYSYEIARRYRGGHPRGYWPCGSDTDLSTAQLWVGGSVTTFATQCGNIIGAIIAAAWSGSGTVLQVNVSFFEGFTSYQNPITLRWRNVPKARTSPLVDTITTKIGRERIGSQRRRLGRG